MKIQFESLILGFAAGVATAFSISVYIIETTIKG